MRAFELYEEPITETGFAAIMRECHEIIRIYQKLNAGNAEWVRVLFRGIGSHAPTIYKRASRTDHKPMSLDMREQEVADAWFKLRGFEARRHNSIFCATTSGQAMGYTDNSDGLYVVFPCDDVAYTWSPKVKDLYHSLPTLNHFDHLHKVLVSAQDPESRKKIMASHLANDLLRAQKLLAGDTEATYEDVVANWLSDQDYQKDNVATALAGHTVGIMATGTFWFVQRDLFDQRLRPKLMGVA